MLFHRLLQKKRGMLSKISFYATMGTFVFFLHFLLKFKPFDEFFPFQNVIANLSLCVATLCECVHPLNKDVSQAIIGTFFSVHFTKDGRMGRFEVCHRFMFKFKPFKM